MWEVVKDDEWAFHSGNACVRPYDIYDGITVH